MRRHSLNPFKLGLAGLLLLAGFLNAAFPAAAQPLHPAIRSGPYLMLATENNWKWSPAVAYAPPHDLYLVVWETINTIDHHTIYGRLVTAASQVYSEFVVYDSEHNSLQPGVAYDSVNDRFLVVWSYDSAGDGLDNDIYGRFIPWNGPSQAYPDFGIETSRANTDKPRVAYGSTFNRFLVTWRVIGVIGDPKYPFEIAGGLIYNDTGNAKFVPISSGPEARDFPDVTYNLYTNQFVVVWDEDVGRDAMDLDIYAARLNIDGVLQFPGEFAVTTSTSNEQHPTVAACYHTGQYFIAWQQQVNQTTNDNIFGRMMSGGGVLDQIYGFAGTTLPQQYPRLSCNPAGTEFFLAWQDMYGANFYPRVGIWAEVVHLDKIVEPAFEVVRPSDTRDRLYPAVAYGRESALVVWQHARDNTNYLDIWAQVVRPHSIFVPVIKK